MMSIREEVEKTMIAACRANGAMTISDFASEVLTQTQGIDTREYARKLVMKVLLGHNKWHLENDNYWRYEGCS